MAWIQLKLALCTIIFGCQIQWVSIAPKVLGQRYKSLGEMQSYGRTYKYVGVRITLHPRH